MSLRLPAPLPIATVLGAIDTTARDTASTAKDHTVAAVRRTLPARTGRQRAAARGRVTRTRTGYQIVVAPARTVRYPNGVTAVQVAGWIEGGTGVHGPHRRPIRPRRGDVFKLPGGIIVPSTQGQKAQHPYERVQSSEEAATGRILAAGATAAARAAERVLAGALR